MEFSGSTPKSRRLCRHWSRWRASLVLIQPATVLRWHREGYRRHWRRRSGESSGRPRIPRSHISLIRRISSENPRWGEDRIALELKVKLGVEHAPRTIRRYMVTGEDNGRPASSTWRTFLAGHAGELWTMDLTTQPLWDYSVRYVLVIMELRSRRVAVIVTRRSEPFPYRLRIKYPQNYESRVSAATVVLCALS